MTIHFYNILERAQRLNETDFSTTVKVQEMIRRSGNQSTFVINDKGHQAILDNIERHQKTSNDIKQYISFCLPQEGIFNSGVYPGTAAITSEPNIISSFGSTLTGAANHPKCLTRHTTGCIRDRLSRRKILEGLPM